MASWIYRRSYKEISLSLALSYNSVSFNYDHWCCCRVWFHKSKIIHRNIRKKNWMWVLKMKAYIDGVFFLIFERQGRSLYQTPLLVSFHVLKGMSIGKTSKIYIVFWLDQPLIVYIYYSRNNMCLIQTWKNKQNLKKQKKNKYQLQHSHKHDLHPLKLPARLTCVKTVEKAEIYPCSAFAQHWNE